jgi:coenzyme Q-binding protein COQ10
VPVLESEVFINASRALVYSVARDIESFPSFMPDVESIDVLERSDDGQRTVTKWVGLVPEFRQKVRWTEEDIWDDTLFTCKFAQVSGDYDVYEGLWRFDEIDAGVTTVFRSTIRYELEIPLIGALLKNLIAKKMRDNTDKILTAIKTRAEEHSAETNAGQLPLS